MKWSYAAALRSPASSSSSSLSPQCRRSVSQGLGSFQSPGAHPSEPPAKLLLSLLHPLSSFVPLVPLVPLFRLLAFISPLRFSLFSTSTIYSWFCLKKRRFSFFFALSLLSVSPSLPFRSSSSPSDPAPLQPCIIRPKHKPVQAHIWKEFGHGSFLPRRLNI